MAAGARRHLRSWGKHLHHRIYYSKTQLPALKRLPPVLRSPASLIDYIASYKLSMVHKLCSSERYTPRRRPAATCTLRAPGSAPAALTGIYLVNYAIRSPGLEKTPGKLAWRKNSKHAAFSVSVIQACRDDTDSQRKTVVERTDNTIWQRTPHRTTVLCVVVNSGNFPLLKMCCKSYGCKHLKRISCEITAPFGLKNKTKTGEKAWFKLINSEKGGLGATGVSELEQKSLKLLLQ